VIPRRTVTLALAAVAALGAAAPARAQFWRQKGDAGTPPTDVAPVALEDVRIDEKLGAQVPLETMLVDWNGRPFRFGDLFGQGKPVVLALVYYECPMLCGLIQSGLARAMRENGLALGKDFQAVSVSFDPDERPAQGAERRRGYLQSMNVDDRTSKDWPFLTGAAASTRAIADAVGFHYQRDEVSGEWAHLAALIVLTPDGRVSRYLYGIEYPPKDFRLSLVEAAGGRVGTSFDRFLLTCYRYDPSSRKYEPYAWGFVRAGGLLALGGLAALVGGLVYRERKGRHAA
jgi:protein SCO1/2